LAFDPQNPSATSAGPPVSMTVYDSLGGSHQVGVYFVNNGNGTWQYHELANGSEVQGGTAGQNVEIGSGTLTFAANGGLTSIATTTPTTVTFDGAQPQTIALNLGTPSTTGGLNGVTQFNSVSAVSSQSADGYSSGSLSGVQIGADGTVSGVYSNGQTVAVGQLAIATFGNNNGLSPTSGSLWAATQTSGAAALGAAGSGGRGSLVSGSLEESNVDIATQFVNLIADQRGFEASSKTITTADQMLQDLMQIVQ
jgi:flagellar hook protein FlgE